MSNCFRYVLFRWFPARWVFVKVIEGDVANIKVGRAVVGDEHLADGIRYCRFKGINYTYSGTTVELFIGTVDEVNFSITKEQGSKTAPLNILGGEP